MNSFEPGNQLISRKCTSSKHTKWESSWSLCTRKQTRHKYKGTKLLSFLCDPLKLSCISTTIHLQKVEKVLHNHIEPHTRLDWLKLNSVQGGSLSKSKGGIAEREGRQSETLRGERKKQWVRILNFCLLQCESYLSISIKLQWRRVASAWGIVWDQLNLQVPANLMTLPKFNHATRAREDLTSTKWHTGVSTSTNWFLYEGLMIPGCLAQQDIKVLMCLLATDCPYKCCFHDIKWHLLIFFTCKKGHWI